MNLAFSLTVVCLLLVVIPSESKVKLKKNSYRGLLIAINPEVKEDPAIINAIKSAWTDASSDLFRATKKRAYFRDITILVPKTWSNGIYNRSNGESYKKAEVVVADQNPVYGDNPYTVQYGRCGEPGSYIHLTPGYLTDNAAVSNYGPRGKTIVHEWAHFRWGVYDETVSNGYDPFYLSRSGKVEANRCPLAVQGENYYVDWSTSTYRPCNIEPHTMLPEDGCVFVPDATRSSAASTSMLSYQYLDSVYTFCHDDTTDAPNLHNRMAPNEHNRLCDLRSTWDVIMQSTDFGNGDNQPNEDIIDTDPTFNVVRPLSYQKFVLVLDTSGSMDGRRMLMMRQAASVFILQAAPTGSEIGLVEFSNRASTLSYLVRIDTYQDRVDLNSKVPDNANGGTSIGSGIREALEVLEKDCDQAKGTECTNGGILIVLSDGQENEDPTLSDVYQETINSGVIVNSIVFTAAADPMLEVISQDTGGVWYFADENDANSTSALTDAFVSVAQIHSSSFTVDKYSTHTGRVVLDKTIGNNTVFTFAWSQYDTLEVVLEAPSGCTYSTRTPPGVACEPGTSPIEDRDIKTIYFPITGTAQTGTWIYYVSTAGPYTEIVVATVTSMASDRDVNPIIVESGMGNVTTSDGEAVVVYAQVSMGYAPVLKADVVATVDRPSGGPVTIVLKDKGAAPDVRKNDGIYSRYFTQYNGQGRYSVQVTVTGIEGKTSSAYQLSNSNAAYKLGTIDSRGDLILNSNGGPIVPTQSPTGNFSRYNSAGGFSFAGKILDLSASQQDVTSNNGGIRIQFTAPGDDYDSGTASYYDIRYTYEYPLNLTTNFDGASGIEPSDVIGGCITGPQEAGSDESMLFLLPDLPSDSTEVEVSVAVRAVDDVGNIGEVSNVVSLNYFIEALIYEAPKETDAELIVMIVFICVSVVLMGVVGLLLWKINKLKKSNKVVATTEPVNKDARHA